MDNTLILTICTLSALGVLAAIILYYVAQKFKVYEDPRIDDVEKMLPGANCGGCGFAGCRGLSDAIVKADSMEGLFCPVAGAESMKAIATYLGRVAEEKDPMIAVVRCNGNCESRPKLNEYDGEKRCVIAASLYAGETACSSGCLGFGDCVTVCAFGAISINKATGLPEVDEEKCTACGKCVSACPKMVIELRKKGVKGRRVFVSCVSTDKGGVTRKACSNGCIACTKCVKACPFDAIVIENNHAYIDYNKCKLCRKCVLECPTGAIQYVNFPTPPPAKKVEPKPAPKVAEVKAEPKVEAEVKAEVKE